MFCLVFRENKLSLHCLRQRQCFITYGVMSNFYAHLLAYILQRYMAVKSRRMLITPRYKHCLWRDREATAFFMFNSIFFLKMPKTGNIGMSTKHSNAQTELPTDLIVELTSKYLIEKNAKNTAYFFILSNNLLKEFQKFCAQHKGVDAHEACIELLSQNNLI